MGDSGKMEGGRILELADFTEGEGGLHRVLEDLIYYKVNNDPDADELYFMDGDL